MAEIVPTIQSSNYAQLAASFGTKASDTTEFKSFTPIFDADGNYLCSAEWDEGDNFTQEADYCGGGAPDIVTALGVLLTAFGDVVALGAGAIWPKLDVTFAAGIQANVKLEGHQHDTTPHVIDTLRTANVASIIPAASGLGVPDLITVVGAVSPINAAVAFEMEHVDKPGADGAHFAGQNMRCRVSLSVDYEGIASAPTAGDWLNIIIASSNPNDDTPTSTLTAEQWIDVAEPTP
jgi:hypothetical protein